jgi:rhodanese-related sulfurtransferase
MTRCELPSGPAPMEVDVQTVKNWIDHNQDFVLIDCREDTEYAVAKIDEAVFIPMSEIQSREAELGNYAGKHVVVHCHHGGRSLRVANWLRQIGFKTAQSMSGGIDAWSQNVDPSVPRY